MTTLYLPQKNDTIEDFPLIQSILKEKGILLSRWSAAIKLKDNDANYLNYRVIFDGKSAKDIAGNNYMVSGLQINPDGKNFSYATLVTYFHPKLHFVVKSEYKEHQIKSSV
jgi:hypothetical protein